MGRNQRRFRRRFEIALGLAGLAMFFFLLPQEISGDGAVRFQAIAQLIEQGQVSSMGYSLVGPLLSVPLYLLGKLHQTPQWWCARFNVLVLTIGLFISSRLLRHRRDQAPLSQFYLLLIAASMFPNHLRGYYGEVLTAVLVVVGILAVCLGRPLGGWCAIVFGTVNSPAAIVGLGFITVKQALDDRRWRHLLALVVAAGLILMESWLRRGHPFTTGYEGNAGIQTILPYSGRPGFSYPFFFGLLSILFSFGKGIIFYAPGLLLSVSNRRAMERDALYRAYRLWMWFLIGLILVYAKWWAWYGGWFWGPRFFLFASIPASFALATRLHRGERSLAEGLTTLSVLALSVWVGINGAVFNQSNLEICTKENYALEALCWYVPEFSPLWRPFIVPTALRAEHLTIIAYGGLVFAYLGFPLLRGVMAQTIRIGADFWMMHLRSKAWRF
jgi:hypothetical protein